MQDFTNWQAYTGSCLNGVDTLYSCSPIFGKHTIMNAWEAPNFKLLDEYCNTIPKTSYSFFSARLGNDTAEAKINALEYTMVVDRSNSLLKVHFAFVLENPQDHNPNERPRFTMQIKDSVGNVMTDFACGNLEFIADTGLQDLACTGELLARDWTTVGFNVEQFIGQTIKIYFEARDGVQGNHFGYAYIMAECMPTRFELEYCPGQITERFFPPDGFARYKWTKSSDSLWVENNQNLLPSLSVDNGNKEIYTCQMTSALDTNCTATLYIVVSETTIDVNFSLDYDTCTRIATFTDLSTLINSEKDEILWEIPELNVTSKDSLFSFTFPDPDDDSVEYLVRLTVFVGNKCTYISGGKWEKEQYITVYPSARVQITGVNHICTGDTAYLKAIPVRYTFINHTWTWEDTNGITRTETGDSIAIYVPGIYRLASETNSGCFARDTFTVTPSKLLMDVAITNVNCYGEATGELTYGEITGRVGGFQCVKWKFDDTIVDGSVMGATYSNLRAGIYSVEALDYRNCLLSEELEIKQSDTLQIIANLQVATSANTPTLKLKATGGIPPYQFEIRKEDNTLISSSDTAWNLSPGRYHIQVTDAVHCVTSDTISVTFEVGISEIKKDNFIVIYPNPVVDGKISIEASVSLIEEGERIIITDITGKTVFISKFYSKQELDVSSLAPGIYIIQMGSVKEKFIRQ
jgi:hypothetical protein